jgi:multimeric flavodoxin WrbA
MKILAICSSPRRNGNSATLLRESIRGAKEHGADVEEIFLLDNNIQHCQGCFSCMAKGKCPIPDDFESIKAKMLAADGIMIAAPTYGQYYNSIYKTFSDRIGMYNVYTSMMAGKYFAGISAGAVLGSNKVAKLLVEISNGFLARGFISGAMGITLGWGHVKDYPKTLEKAYKLGSRVAIDIKTGAQYPFQGLYSRLLGKLFLSRVMRKNILQNKDGKLKAVYENVLSRGLMN